MSEDPYLKNIATDRLLVDSERTDTLSSYRQEAKKKKVDFALSSCDSERSKSEVS